jgi:hypothetical protein
MENTEETEDQVRRLTRAVDEMRERMAALEAGEPKQHNGSGPSSRRGFLRLGAAAALGAVGWAAVKVVPASAATGGTFILGQANLAENPTTIAADGGTPPVQVLAAKDATFILADLAAAGGFLGTLQGLGAHTGIVEGVDGWAQGTQAFGVYGLTDSGAGVVGESNTGIGLYARRSGRIRQDGLTTTGPGVAPPYPPNLFEQVRDTNGVLWINNASAAWRRVNSVRTDTADGAGNAFKPVRILDTRGPLFNQPRKAAGSVTPIVVAGQGTGASHIPADAIAVMGNLTAADYTGGGFLVIMPNGITIGPGAGQYNPQTDPSSVNFQVGQGAISNSFICGLNAGSLEVYVGGPPLPGHDSHFILDITAYIQ